ncbi:MAG TPA: sialate O-acetylesterase [Hanamia sp.]|nr:sialate O-acetylesterase [Hanamia sp.]
MTFKAKYYFTFFLLFCVAKVNAGVTLPKIIRSDMVLQRGQKVPIWGEASAGEKITVTFHNQTKNAVADKSGKWMVNLDKMNASALPSEMIIKGNNTITLKNILVGEVWLCSGQSNMEYTMRKNSKVVKTDSSKNSPIDELERANNPDIRIFLVTQKNLLYQDSSHSGWSIAKDSALRSFSAAGYFFAKELYAKLHVPIGMISAAIPGSAIEPWLSGAIPKQQQKDKPIKLDESQPGKFYPKMIQPLAPFAIKGFLWYQGETNCFQNESIEYTYKMQALINGWRKLWKDNKLPFYYVQIAPFYYSKSAGKYPLTVETEPKFWEAQTLAMNIPYTGMVVINDLSNSPDDLHPRGKWEVGRRLAQWALAKDYGLKVVPSGPIYKRMKITNGKIELEFNYLGKGLESKDGKPLTWFTIAGANGKFVPAKAVIEGNKVIVSSPLVPDPKNVRFAWSEAAQPNFFNKDGLPAVPFRTDNPLHFVKTE